jgi:hypothetical protein
MVECLAGDIRAPTGKCGALSARTTSCPCGERGRRPADKGPTVSTRWSSTRLTRHIGEHAPGGLISLRVGAGRRTSMWVERAQSVLEPPGPIWPW